MAYSLLLYSCWLFGSASGIQMASRSPEERVLGRVTSKLNCFELSDRISRISPKEELLLPTGVRTVADPPLVRRTSFIGRELMTGAAPVFWRVRETCTVCPLDRLDPVISRLDSQRR